MFSGKYKHIFQLSAVRTGVCAYVRMNATLLALVVQTVDSAIQRLNNWGLEIKILVNVISLGLWLG